MSPSTRFLLNSESRFDTLSFASFHTLKFYALRSRYSPLPGARRSGSQTARRRWPRGQTTAHRRHSAPTARSSSDPETRRWSRRQSELHKDCLQWASGQSKSMRTWGKGLSYMEKIIKVTCNRKYSSSYKNILSLCLWHKLQVFVCYWRL